jgi:AcrR family transcriptional regulator
VPAEQPVTTTRDAVLDAAERLLRRPGYAKATLDELAREAGVSRRKLSALFTTREEVFLASIDRVIERLLVELERIAAEKAGPDVRLWRMLVTRVMTRFDSVRTYHESLDEMLADLRQPYLERRERYFARESEVIARVIDEGRRKLAWEVEDGAALARTLVVATNALLPCTLSREELASRPTVQTQATSIASLLLRGLQASAQEALPRRGRAGG